jgi:hypothetical protein
MVEFISLLIKLSETNLSFHPFTKKLILHGFFYYYSWGGTKSTRYCGHFWPLVQAPDDRWGDCGAIGEMKIGRGNRSTRRKPAPAPLCPTTNPTWPDPGSNPGRRSGKPATNRLSYGAATAARLLNIQYHTPTICQLPSRTIQHTS